MIVDQFLSGISARLVALTMVILVSQAALVGRLWYEQAGHGPEHAEEVANQSIRRLRVPPVRGRIFARDESVLADNRLRYDVYFHIHEMRQPRSSPYTTLEFVRKQVLDIEQLTGHPCEVSDEPKVDASGNPLLDGNGRPKLSDLAYHVIHFKAYPLRAFRALDQEAVARLYTHFPKMQGVDIQVNSDRIYPLGDIGAHLIGSVRYDYPRQEREMSFNFFEPDIRGRNGLELIYNDILSGRSGYKLIQIDYRGFRQEKLFESDDPEMGQDLVLTLDPRAMKIGRNLMQGHKGALVFLDIHTGEVLAMISSPTYDPNTVLSGKDYQGLWQGEWAEANKPLLNRALAGGYNCGSIIKPLVALSAMDVSFQDDDQEAPVIDPDDLVNCPGYYQLNGLKIRCANRFGHGDINMQKAIEVSCNTYFIDVGLRLGVDRLRETFLSGGIGQPTGFELAPGRREGLLPGREEKRERLNDAWRSGDTALVSIGQGFIGVSPLQAAVYTAAIANDGILLRPRLVRGVRDTNGEMIQTTQPDVRGQLRATPGSLAIVREAMHQVVYGRDASAPAARSDIVDLAGKTGTAEVGPRSNRTKNTWFVCFGPYKSPRYAMAVLVEDGRSGGKTCAPIAKRFFELYLSEGGEYE